MSTSHRSLIEGRWCPQRVAQLAKMIHGTQHHLTRCSCACTVCNDNLTGMYKCSCERILNHGTWCDSGSFLEDNQSCLECEKVLRNGCCHVTFLQIQHSSSLSNLHNECWVIRLTTTAHSGGTRNLLLKVGVPDQHV